MLIYLQELETEDEKDTFEQIYQRYGSLMFHVAHRILRNEQDAEDAVHQAFESILKNLEKISDVECPKTRSYIVIIVERKALDLLRARQRGASIEYDDDALGVQVPPPGGHPLADAMAKLPARYRQILLLRFDCGYRTRELAKMLDLSPGSVQKLIWRAKAALKEQLEKDGDLP